MQATRDIARLLEIMVALRNPTSGCAWDIAQTHETLAPYAVEEAYEVVDAIERGDRDDLRDELGDVLLQVVFHARVAEEAGSFDFGDVVEGITGKMVRRHPYVFSAGRLPAPEDGRTDFDKTGTVASWQRIKAEERKAQGRLDDRGVLSGVPTALPGLTRAVKLQTKASSVGFDWNDPRLVLEKIREEIAEVEAELDRNGTREAMAGEIGDLLFAVANLARHFTVDPEAAVRTTNAKFERRFAFIERQLQLQGTSAEAATLEAMDQLWDAAKHAGL